MDGKIYALGVMNRSKHYEWKDIKYTHYKSMDKSMHEWKDKSMHYEWTDKSMHYEWTDK